jgi:hypothetical protein
MCCLSKLRGNNVTITTPHLLTSRYEGWDHYAGTTYNTGAKQAHVLELDVLDK